MISYKLYGKSLPESLKSALNAICKSANDQLNICESVYFDVNIVDTKQITFINKKYRKINNPTDVISFANRDYKDVVVPLLGEIFICLNIAKKQAKQYKHSLNREIIFLFTHGLLHLLGYDHITKKQEKIMFDLTDKIINKAQINPKYIIK